MVRVPRGRPAAIQAWQSVRQAATRRARLARTQIIRSGWRKPSRCQGRSTCASSRMRTRRRAISLENSGLLPVAIQTQRIGSRAISETPRMRSSQNGAVSAAARAELSSFWRRLSISTIDGICRSLAVTRLRHSSSSRALGHDGGAGAGENAWRWRRPSASRRCRASASRSDAAAWAHRSWRAGSRAAAAPRHARVRRRDEREIAQQVIADQRARGRDLLGRRALRRSRGTSNPGAGA